VLPIAEQQNEEDEPVAHNGEGLVCRNIQRTSTGGWNGGFKRSIVGELPRVLTFDGAKRSKMVLN
jgi:hypothetical protein